MKLERDQLLSKYGLFELTDVPEPFLEHSLHLASKVCKTPVAYISILGEKYQYILSQKGASIQTMETTKSICQHTIQGNEMLVIQDTRKDERTQALDLVTTEDDPVIFYAGYPLIDEDDNALGAFCVTDNQDRELTEDQLGILKILGKQIIAYLTFRKPLVDIIQQQGKELNAKYQTTKQLIDEVDSISNQLADKIKQLSKTQKTVTAQKEELLHMTNLFPGSVAKIDREFRYVFNNDKYEEWTGLSTKDIHNKKITSVIGEEIFQKYQHLYERAFEGETVKTEGFFVFNKAKRHLQVTYMPVKTGTQITGAYVFSEDITELKSYQSQLENSNEKLQDFAYMVCHDIQSPLRTMMDFGKLLKKDLQQRGIVYNEVFLNYIIDSGKRLNRLITDLLDFARVNQQFLEKESFAVKDILDTVQLNLLDLIRQNDATVNHQLGQEAILGFRTDFILLFQNLISNAIKYRKPGEAPTINVNFSIKNNRMGFEVNDNGRGIPEDKFEEIFQPFKRIYDENQTVGTGIGLATCQKIIEKYKSTFLLKSTVGVGSSFFFSLPLGQEFEIKQEPKELAKKG